MSGRFIHLTGKCQSLDHYFKHSKCKPNIIDKSECGLIKKPPLPNTGLPNLCFEFTPAEYRKGVKMI